MGPIEKLGLLKMDFLGLKTLTVLTDAVRLVRESRGIALDLDALPLDDARTYQLLSDARTFGVFQLESAGMREALQKLRPERIEDIIAMVALYRPGPMDLIPEFVNRRHGRAEITYEHPLMQRHLEETYGIMVYQEQVMRLAADMAGFSLAEADTLRKAMGKKDRELMAQQSEKFVSGCKKNGIEARKANRIWDLIEKFAGYGFNKSHAACYGIVAYQTAYLKANYPVEFMAALLTSEMERTDKIVQYIDECRAMGLQVAPPDVNRSQVQFSVSGDVIRFGLAAIKNVGAAAIESIVKVREDTGAFTSLADFSARVDLRLLNRRVIESLIKAGAFDGLNRPRAALLGGLDQAMELGQRRQRDREEGQASLFDALTAGSGPAPVEEVPSIAAVTTEWPREQLLGYEREVLGLYISGHPLERYRTASRRLGALGAADLAARPVGARVALLGQVSQMRERATKSGNRMAFATLELVDGAAALTVFPEALRTHGGALRAPGPVLVRGRVDDTDKGRVVLVEEAFQAERLPGFAPDGEDGAPPPAVVIDESRHAHACRLRIPAAHSAAGGTPGDLMERVRAACQAHPGETPIFVHVLLDDQEVVIKATGVGVTASRGLLEAVEALLGEGAVVVEYGRPA
jgi:DNA polymerase-3 subunit alpha